MSETMARRSGPLHRISSSDFAVAEEVLLYNHITPRGTDPDDLQRYDLTGSVLGQSFTATVTGLLKDLLPHMAGLEPKEQAAN